MQLVRFLKRHTCIHACIYECMNARKKDEVNVRKVKKKEGMNELLTHHTRENYRKKEKEEEEEPGGEKRLIASGVYIAKIIVFVNCKVSNSVYAGNCNLFISLRRKKKEKEKYRLVDGNIWHVKLLGVFASNLFFVVGKKPRECNAMFSSVTTCTFQK